MHEQIAKYLEQSRDTWLNSDTYIYHQHQEELQALEKAKQYITDPIEFILKQIEIAERVDSRRKRPVTHKEFFEAKLNLAKLATAENGELTKDYQAALEESISNKDIDAKWDAKLLLEPLLTLQTPTTDIQTQRKALLFPVMRMVMYPKQCPNPKVFEFILDLMCQHQKEELKQSIKASYGTGQDNYLLYTSRFENNQNFIILMKRLPEILSEEEIEDVLYDVNTSEHTLISSLLCRNDPVAVENFAALMKVMMINPGMLRVFFCDNPFVDIAELYKLSDKVNRNAIRLSAPYREQLDSNHTYHIINFIHRAVTLNDNDNSNNGNRSLKNFRTRFLNETISKPRNLFTIIFNGKNWDILNTFLQSYQNDAFAYLLKINEGKDFLHFLFSFTIASCAISPEEDKALSESLNLIFSLYERMDSSEHLYHALILFGRHLDKFNEQDIYLIFDRAKGILSADEFSSYARIVLQFSKFESLPIILPAICTTLDNEEQFSKLINNKIKLNHHTHPNLLNYMLQKLEDKHLEDNDKMMEKTIKSLLEFYKPEEIKSALTYRTYCSDSYHYVAPHHSAARRLQEKTLRFILTIGASRLTPKEYSNDLYLLGANDNMGVFDTSVKKLIEKRSSRCSIKTPKILAVLDEFAPKKVSVKWEYTENVLTRKLQC